VDTTERPSVDLLITMQVSTRVLTEGIRFM
jgi:hypothetical protein